jgi:hypothetical protein
MFQGAMRPVGGMVCEEQGELVVSKVEYGDGGRFALSTGDKDEAAAIADHEGALSLMCRGLRTSRS